MKTYSIKIFWSDGDITNTSGFSYIDVYIKEATKRLNDGKDYSVKNFENVLTGEEIKISEKESFYYLQISEF